MLKRPWFNEPQLVFGVTLLVFMFVLAFMGPWFAPPPDAIDPDLPTHAPLMGHWLGTDELGRDLLARLALGAQISLIIGFSASCVAVGFGTLYGMIAAMSAKWIDQLMMRLIEVLYALPSLMVVILLSLFLGRNLFSLVLALASLSWLDTARLIRGQVTSLMREEFVEAFHSLGGHPVRLACSHLLRNLTSFIILSTTMTVPRAILTESTLSFVGLGVAPPLSSWGTMISDGWQMIRIAPHLIIIPALLLLLTTVSLNWIGDSLNNRLNPRT